MALQILQSLSVRLLAVYGRPYYRTKEVACRILLAEVGLYCRVEQSTWGIKKSNLQIYYEPSAHRTSVSGSLVLYACTEPYTGPCRVRKKCMSIMRLRANI